MLMSALAWATRRPRITVRIATDEPNEPVGGLVFEVENTSLSVCSLATEIQVKVLYPCKGKLVPGTAIFDVRELDRELPPYKAKLFSATARVLPPGYGHAWFLTYVFRPTRGIAKTFRSRNAMLQPTTYCRFHLERIAFKLTGRLPGNTEMTSEEYKAIKRSQGPH